MNKDLLYYIAKDIKDIYVKMSINENEKIDNTENINKLKELISIEKDFYDNLTFEETMSLFEKYINYKDKDNDIIGRIINRLNDLLGDKYFDESIETDSKLNNALFGDVYRTLLDSGLLKKSVTCKSFIIRDIRLLTLYMLKEIEKDGYISDEFYIGKEFCEIYRISQTYILSYFYSDLEKEFIDNNFKIPNFNLVSNLSYQLQQLPYFFYSAAKEDTLNEELRVIIDEYNKLDNNSLIDDDGVIRILNMISMIKALVVIEESVIDLLINKLESNEKNNEIYNIVIENLRDVRKERKNIKYLSLKMNDKYS